MCFPRSLDIELGLYIAGSWFAAFYVGSAIFIPEQALAYGLNNSLPCDDSNYKINVLFLNRPNYLPLSTNIIIFVEAMAVVRIGR